MNILVLNSGSSSLKYQLINNDQVLVKGNIERINNYDSAIKEILQKVDKVDAIGHRVVHGGEVFKESTLVNKKAIEQLEKLIPLAPLHNPANIAGIKACVKALPNIPNVMVFDTAFHSKMPKSSFLYAIPYEDYTKHGIRRYGFHGTSHFYVANKAAEVLGKPLEKLKLITCHLGNGGSVAAISGGHSVDTSLGFTPLEGLIMGTRSGDVDAGVVQYLCRVKNMSIDETLEYLNKKSGLLGICGSNDMRDMLEDLSKGNNALAREMYVYRLKKYIGSYLAALNGADAIIFTGGIGERDTDVRQDSMRNMQYAGIMIDEKKNRDINWRENKINEITAKDGKIRVFVIPTNEELVIAKETEKVIK